MSLAETRGNRPGMTTMFSMQQMRVALSEGSNYSNYRSSQPYVVFCSLLSLLFFSQAGSDVSNLLYKPSCHTELPTELTLLRQG